MDSAERMKHLEFIQAVISRLANTSVLLKGWGITVVSALVGFAATKDGQPILAAIALIPLFAFAALDAYYLWLERVFRAHYARVVEQPEIYGFRMHVHDIKEKETWRNALTRPVVWWFWLALFISDTAALVGLCIAKHAA